MRQITIIDYGSGNVLSAQKSFIKVANDNNIKAKVLISKNLNEIKNSSHIVLAWSRSLFNLYDWFKVHTRFN